MFSSACDKVPLLAPTGTVITLFPTANTVPVNGEVEIIATVIENGVATAPPSTGTGTGTGGNGTGTDTGTGTTTTSSSGSGTPVQNGTLVSFTTTIGRIEPSEARTNNGQVRVRFIAGGQSGTATVTAYSGGASGRIENLLVGTAAAERVILTATPQTLGASGGSSEISARVENTSGLGLPGVPVNFTATTGTLSASTATTDANGVARVFLNTTRQSEVTANVAGKTATVTVGLNPRTGIALTAPTTSTSAGQAATFTVDVSSDANIRNVSLDWGDGETTNLGALSGSQTVSHVYDEEGTYTVRASAVDASGFSETVSTSFRVLPPQPPSVIVTVTDTTPAQNQVVIVTAQVSGNTSSIVRFEWSFGADANPTSAVTTGNQASVSWSGTGSRVITVRAVQANGVIGDGFAAVVVGPGGGD